MIVYCVKCDECGTVQADARSSQGGDIARAMAFNRGWRTVKTKARQTVDLCPECKPKETPADAGTNDSGSGRGVGTGRADAAGGVPEVRPTDRGPGVEGDPDAVGAQTNAAPVAGVRRVPAEGRKA